MITAKTKALWYAKNIRNLLIACLRILFYCLRHPKQFSKLTFPLLSTINEFYQVSHGRLHHFEETKIYQAIKDDKVFSQCNIFNSDPKVARPIETQILSALTCHLKPQTIFEIGTYNGFTTLHFAHNSPESAKVFTLDLPQDYQPDFQKKDTLSKYSYDDFLVVKLSHENFSKRIYKGHMCEKKISELFGDSRDFDFAPYYGKVDLVYIDGSHSYDYVKSDTENAFKMLSKDGVIIWHDFDYIIHRDVFTYLNELVEQHKIYSIPRTRLAIYGASL